MSLGAREAESRSCCDARAGELKKLEDLEDLADLKALKEMTELTQFEALLRRGAEEAEAEHVAMRKRISTFLVSGRVAVLSNELS